MGNINSNMTDQTNETNQGSLHLFIGPMYAGKTSKLIDVYEDCIENEEKCVILTHSTETRYSIDKLSTHDQKKVTCFKYESIMEFMNEQKETIKQSNTILIDESQFFLDLKIVLRLVNTFHKRVFIFGLDGDFQQNKFGQILDLIPHCDTVEKLTAKCNMCEDESEGQAIFSHRITESTEQVLVGSNDAYQSLCRHCYNKTNQTA
jgi:thymidine kinase|tara:strand:+ start:4529 stop:5143 length:615 start_codon:yes stop_codon:yes gene_type:complete